MFKHMLASGCLYGSLVFCFPFAQAMRFFIQTFKQSRASLHRVGQMFISFWSNSVHLHFNNIEWVATGAWIQCDPSVVFLQWVTTRTMGRSWTRSRGGAAAPTARSGGAPRRRTPTPSTASATCTVAATVQESLWNPRPPRLRIRRSPSCPPWQRRPERQRPLTPSPWGVKLMACLSVGLAHRSFTSMLRMLIIVMAASMVTLNLPFQLSLLLFKTAHWIGLTRLPRLVANYTGTQLLI